MRYRKTDSFRKKHPSQYQYRIAMSTASKKTIYHMAIVLAFGILVLGLTTNNLIFAQSSDEAREVSKREMSFDANRIIPYCYDALFSGFSSGYPASTCDISISYFDINCQNEPSQVELWNYCASQELRDMMDYYIQQRDLFGLPDPGLYYPLE